MEQSDNCGKILERVDPDRRNFVKRFLAGAAFAAPVLTTFAIDALSPRSANAMQSNVTTSVTPEPSTLVTGRGRRSHRRGCSSQGAARQEAGSVERRRTGSERIGRLLVLWLLVKPAALGRNPRSSSAAMIVKNEERFLALCLASIRDFVDQIVVVDTGSTDRSKHPRLQLGRSSRKGPGTGISLTRNEALSLARGDWILYIDADETMRPGNFAQVRSELALSEMAGYYVRLHPRPGFTPYRILRIFRNHPDIRFSGVIHENMWPSILRRYSESDVGTLDLALDHAGYEGDQSSKHARNLPLLRKALRENPAAVFPVPSRRDLHGARKAALRRTRLATGPRYCSREEQARARRLPSVCRAIPVISERGEDAGSLVREAIGRFPCNAHAWWLEGRVLMQSGKFEAAIDAFERVLSLGKNGNHDSDVACDRRIFDVLTYDSLATCHFRLCDYARARHFYELAASCDPAPQEYRVKSALCARLERSHGKSAKG